MDNCCACGALDTAADAAGEGVASVTHNAPDAVILSGAKQSRRIYDLTVP